MSLDSLPVTRGVVFGSASCLVCLCSIGGCDYVLSLRVLFVYVTAVIDRVLYVYLFQTHFYQPHSKPYPRDECNILCAFLVFFGNTKTNQGNWPQNCTHFRTNSSKRTFSTCFLCCWYQLRTEKFTPISLSASVQSVGEC